MHAQMEYAQCFTLFMHGWQLDTAGELCAADLLHAIIQCHTQHMGKTSLYVLLIYICQNNIGLQDGQYLHVELINDIPMATIQW